MWEFPYFGVLIIRILLFRVLFLGSPIVGNSHVMFKTRQPLNKELAPEDSIPNF